VKEAIWLRDRGATAMIDISDGLAADATHIAAASGVRCVLDADLVPAHPAVTARDAALTSGEEYELLVALPSGQPPTLSQEFQSTFGIALTKVGDVSAGSGAHIIRDGREIEVVGEFRHF
jgi:thiamine-monophosphate kinase